MSIETFSFASRGPSADSAGREILIGEWREFDSLGAVMRRRSLASSWQVARVLMWALILAIAFGALVGLSMITRRSLFFAFGWTGALAGPFRTMAKRFRRHLMGETDAESDAEQPVVCVGYDVDGIEYGRDLGRLSYEGDWLYFEGERSSISLGKADILASRFTSRGGIRLTLDRCSERIQIRIDPVAEETSRLPNEFTTWSRWAGETAGVAVYPPMALPTGDESHSAGLWGETTLYAVLGVVLGWLVVSMAGGGGVWGLAPLVWTAVGAAAGIVGHRIWVRQRQLSAFARLPGLRELVRP